MADHSNNVYDLLALPSASAALPCLRRAILLHILSSDVSKRHLSPRTLHLIESFQSLNPQFNPLATEAYLSVAAHVVNTAPDFASSVASIFLHRIGAILESPDASGLATDRMKAVSEEMEKALTDHDLRSEISARYTLEVALDALTSFLNKERDEMQLQPCPLETIVQIDQRKATVVSKSIPSPQVNKVVDEHNTSCSMEKIDSLCRKLYETPEISSDNTEDILRFHLEKPRRNPLSPLIQKVSRQPRRKYRKWNILEEYALRKGVEKFGTGNWKMILDHFCDTFDKRTEVDLKDKWRNITKNKRKETVVSKSIPSPQVNKAVDKLMEKIEDPLPADKIADSLHRKEGEDESDSLHRKVGKDKTGIQAIVNEDASHHFHPFTSLVSELDVFNSKPWYLELRESREIENLAELLPYFKEKEKKLRCLVSLKEKIDSAYKKALVDEYNLRNTIDALKMGLKIGEDSIKETDKVLSELDTNLRAKLVADMNYLREQIGTVQKQIAILIKSREALESKNSGLEELISSWTLKVQELERMLEEMRMMGSTGEHVRDHIEKLLPDYQEIIFDMELKNLEIELWEESLCQESNTLDEVSGKLSLVMEKLNGFLCLRKSLDLCDLKGNSICLSEIFAKQLSLDDADC